MPSRTLIVYLALSLFLCIRPSCAQQTPALYFGAGRMLQAAPPRQLSLNAHVEGFLFQPGGLSIAYVGVHDEGDKRTVTVRLAGARATDDPNPQTLFRVTGDTPDARVPEPYFPDIDLIGWSLNARYLIIRQIEEDDAASDQPGGSLTTQYFSVDVGVTPFRMRPVPTPQLPGNGLMLPQTAWSPDHHRLLMAAENYRKDAQGGWQVPSAAAGLYDPDHPQMLPVTVPDGLHVWGWLDDGHLLFLRPPPSPGDKTTYISQDIATGADSDIPRPSPWPPLKAQEMWFTRPASQPVTPDPPGLTLETQYQTLPDAQKVAETPANSIWVRRAAAPRALSATAVSVTPGPDDPQAAWSPTGKSVAFLAHGDLFVADLTPRDTTASEKVAAGETLSCDEEKQVIMSHLKQFGLGVIQYAQDNDEKFPSADGWHDAVYPYIKSEEIFKFAGVPVIYHAPANLSLASIDSPADTVLATSDTPCAHIVLFVDGHVKAFDKGDKSAPSGQ